MINAYDKVYLEKARVNLGRMLDFAVYDLKLDIKEFFDRFIISGVANAFENGDSKTIAGKSGVELAYEVMEKTGENVRNIKPRYTANRSEEYWTGWALAYYQWETGMRFEDMVKNGLTLSTVFSMYILHEADESKFTDASNEIINRNKMNKNSRLHDIRKARGFTQQELSEASGVSLRMIQLYEQRRNDIGKAQVNVVLALAKALGCEIEDLIE